MRFSERHSGVEYRRYWVLLTEKRAMTVVIATSEDEARRKGMLSLGNLGEGFVPSDVVVYDFDPWFS